MKKLFIVLPAILCALMFVGCKKYTYNGKSLGAKEFINLEELTGSFESLERPGVIYQRVFRDVHTGVLYTSLNLDSLTPIMEADGTCLTYDEWILRNNH